MKGRFDLQKGTRIKSLIKTTRKGTMRETVHKIFVDWDDGERCDIPNNPDLTQEIVRPNSNPPGEMFRIDDYE